MVEIRRLHSPESDPFHKVMSDHLFLMPMIGHLSITFSTSHLNSYSYFGVFSSSLDIIEQKRRIGCN